MADRAREVAGRLAEECVEGRKSWWIWEDPPMVLNVPDSTAIIARAIREAEIAVLQRALVQIDKWDKDNTQHGAVKTVSRMILRLRSPEEARIITEIEGGESDA